MKTETAYILDFSTPIPPMANNPLASYSREKQLWINQETDEPLVLTYSKEKFARSPFGETILTESGEGTDASEISAGPNLSSPFGETLQTRNECEGTDIGAQNICSRFGETTMTFTQEGIDATSSLKASRFGETMITKTSEGADQTSETM